VRDTLATQRDDRLSTPVSALRLAADVLGISDHIH
jgi:hypothetical protein